MAFLVAFGTGLTSSAGPNPTSRIAPLPEPTGKARLAVRGTRDERWREWSALSEGCYLLRTNLTETDAAVLWQRYIQLTEAEWAFRITKNELEIRPT